MRYTVYETTKSSSGYADYTKSYEGNNAIDSAKREYHRFLSVMENEPSVEYCMASVIADNGDSVMKESWYAKIVGTNVDTTVVE